jgi:predicted peroxiredoxin
VSIILAGDAAELILGDNAETMEGLGLPPMRELIEKVKKHSIPVYV